jgi:hypothetical protein
MATTPDEKEPKSKKQKVVEEVRKATNQNGTRAAVAIAAFVAVGTDRIEAAIPIAVLVFISGGKR